MIVSQSVSQSVSHNNDNDNDNSNNNHNHNHNHNNNNNNHNHNNNNNNNGVGLMLADGQESTARSWLLEHRSKDGHDYVGRQCIGHGHSWYGNILVMATYWLYERISYVNILVMAQRMATHWLAHRARIATTM